MITSTQALAALAVVEEQIAEAVAQAKCGQCGCLQATVDALAATEAGKGALAVVLADARSKFNPRRYDCLGCAVCHPAVAANAFGDAYPGEADGLSACPTEEPDVREGWPPLPGDFRVLRYVAPVAVCVLNSEALVGTLAAAAPEGLALVGTMHTENLGIERIVKNVLANPEIRFLILCGEDTRQAIGHLPGQSLASLFANGVDERGRIVGAKGKRPVLKNLSADEVRAFLSQVELLSMIGETDVRRIAAEVQACAERSPGPVEMPFRGFGVPRIRAGTPAKLVLDPAGYFVVYPEASAHVLVLEHYTNAGVLDCVLEGDTVAALCSEIVRRGLISRLDHAAYLGRELTRAEASLASATRFIQDAAPDGPAEAQDGASHSGPECGCMPVIGITRARAEGCAPAASDRPRSRLPGS